METCARLVTYRGFGGDAEAAEAAMRAISSGRVAPARPRRRPQPRGGGTDGHERQLATCVEAAATSSCDRCTSSYHLHRPDPHSRVRKRVKSGVACSCEAPLAPAGGPFGRSNGPDRPSPPEHPQRMGPMDTFVPRRRTGHAIRAHTAEHVQGPPLPWPALITPPTPPRTPFTLPHPTPPTPGPRERGLPGAQARPSAPRSWVSSSATRRCAQAAAGGFRPGLPRTDARYQAPPAVYISGLFFCTWHKTARILDAGTAWGRRRKTTFYLLRPPSPPTLPLLPPLLLPPLLLPPFLPSPRLSPRLAPPRPSPGDPHGS